MATKYDKEFAEWYAEDAKRLEDLGKDIEKHGAKIKVMPDEDPPELNPDGSYKKKETEGEDRD